MDRYKLVDDKNWKILGLHKSNNIEFKNLYSPFSDLMTAPRSYAEHLDDFRMSSQIFFPTAMIFCSYFYESSGD